MLNGLPWLANCLLATSFALPEDPQHVVLKDGTAYDAEIVAIDDAAMTLSFEQDGETVTLALARDRFAAPAWYRVRTRSLDADPRALIELARFGAANGLYFQAERDLRRALALDAALAGDIEPEITRVRDAAAGRLLALAGEALAADDVKAAGSLLATTLTRYGDTAPSAAARELVDRVAARRREIGAAKAAARIAELATDAAVQEERALDGATQFLEQGRDRNLDGLKEKSLGQAQSAFLASARAYGSALRELERIEARDDRGARKDRIAELRGDISRETIEVRVSLGSTYLVRGSFQEALAQAHLALAIDSKSSDAREFRARVEIASAEGSRGRDRRRRPGA